jgi:glutamate-1-semialdehyde 2,1-aminomutase
MKHEKNIELTERFNAVYPCGHSNYGIPVEAGDHRVFIARAEGARMWDVDGNEYIDYMGAKGPTILGHRHPEYIKALTDYLAVNSTAIGSGIMHRQEDVLLGEKLVRHIPCADKVKFCLSGSEAVQMAFRLARAYTGRPYFLRFTDHYHGWLDNVLGAVLNPDPEAVPHAVENQELDLFTHTQGKSAVALQESLMVPWNDADRLEQVLEKYGDQVAIIHFEGIVFNHFGMFPRPGFLEKVRELCTKYGIVMCMDEIITGFRIGIDGAQGYLGVTPDLATFGKAMAGGIPHSAVAGKKEILAMLTEGKVLGPGTFNGHPLGIEAALTTVGILERDDGAVYREMARVQKRLTDGLQDLARKYGLPLLIQGTTGGFFTMFGVEKDVVYVDEDLSTLDVWMLFDFVKKMQNEGVVMLQGGRWYMTVVHTDRDIDQTLEAADRVMATLKPTG